MFRRLFPYFFSSPLSPEELLVQDMIHNDSELSDLFAKTQVPVSVRECPPGVRACYQIKLKEIWISPLCFECASLHEVLLHEYIHAYDHLVKGIEISTVRVVSTTEIHALMRCECKSAFFPRSCTYANAVRAVTLSTGNEKLARTEVSAVFDEVYDRYSSPKENPYPVFFDFNSPYQ
jgi:hypothetical protein